MVLVITLGMVTIGMCVEILDRFIVGITVAGIEEFIMLFAVYLYYLGMAQVTNRKGHITVDALAFISKKGIVRSISRFSDLFSPLICMLVLYVYSYYAVEYCYVAAINKRMTDVIGYPMVILYASISIGLVLTSIFFTLHFARGVRALKNYGKETVT